MTALGTVKRRQEMIRNAMILMRNSAIFILSVVYDVQMGKKSFNEDLDKEIFDAIGDGSFAEMLEEPLVSGSPDRSTRSGVVAAIHGPNVLVEFGPKDQGCCPKTHFEAMPQIGTYWMTA